MSGKTSEQQIMFISSETASTIQKVVDFNPCIPALQSCHETFHELSTFSYMWAGNLSNRTIST